MQVTTIVLDLAKSWFQIHGVDANGEAVIRRKLKRNDVIGIFKALPSCLVGIDACATAHYRVRELSGSAIR